MIKVSNIVDVYEKNGVETKVGSNIKLIVDSVWNSDKQVKLRTHDGDEYVVAAKDLITAINNATNTANY